MSNSIAVIGLGAMGIPTAAAVQAQYEQAAEQGLGLHAQTSVLLVLEGRAHAAA